jgi:hypothetical protein
MTPPDQSSGKFNIQFGDVSDSQLVVGDYNTVSQRIGLTPEEAVQLRAVFADFKSAVAEQSPEELRADAQAHADELERAVVTERPDPGAVRRVLRWFKEHAPELAGVVAGVVINPLVGKLVEGAGAAIADRFRSVVREEL